MNVEKKIVSILKRSKDIGLNMNELVIISKIQSGRLWNALSAMEVSNTIFSKRIGKFKYYYLPNDIVHRRIKTEIVKNKVVLFLKDNRGSFTWRDIHERMDFPQRYVKKVIRELSGGTRFLCTSGGRNGF